MAETYVLIVAVAWPTEFAAKELSNSVPTLNFKATANPGQNSGGGDSYCLAGLHWELVLGRKGSKTKVS